MPNNGNPESLRESQRTMVHKLTNNPSKSNVTFQEDPTLSHMADYDVILGQNMNNQIQNQLQLPPGHQQNADLNMKDLPISHSPSDRQHSPEQNQSSSKLLLQLRAAQDSLDSREALPPLQGWGNRRKSSDLSNQANFQLNSQRQFELIPHTLGPPPHAGRDTWHMLSGK